MFGQLLPFCSCPYKPCGLVIFSCLMPDLGWRIWAEDACDIDASTAISLSSMYGKLGVDPFSLSIFFLLLPSAFNSGYSLSTLAEGENGSSMFFF